MIRYDIFAIEACTPIDTNAEGPSDRKLLFRRSPQPSTLSYNRVSQGLRFRSCPGNIYPKVLELTELIVKDAPIFAALWRDYHDGTETAKQLHKDL